MIRGLAGCLAMIWMAVAAAAPASAPSLPSGQGRSLADSVATLIRDVESQPYEFSVRGEKAWRTLAGPGMAEPASPEVGRLRAYYFHRLMREYASLRRDRDQGAGASMDSTLREMLVALRKRYGKTEAELRGNPDTLQTQGPGRFRFLAAEALMRKDTLGALRAYRLGWDRFRLEDDFLELYALQAARHADRRGATDSLLAEGLRLLPGSPATRAVAFSAWIGRGDSSGARQALELSTRAQSEWDGSPEWKVRHARALLACGRPREAEPMLMRALDLLDDAQPGAEESARLRKEIFSLTESAHRNNR